MFRALLAITLIPAALLLGWLALAAPEKRADFVVATDGELRTIDPHRVSWLDEIQVAQALFEGLTRMGLRSQRPEPALAERWQFDAQENAYTFSLRPGLRYSNGEPLLAADFAFAWRRVLDPSTQSQYVTLLFEIAGAEAYYRSRLNDDPADDLSEQALGVRVVDPRTLQVRLARPCPHFLELLSFPVYSPVNPRAVERFRTARSAAGGSGEFLWTRAGNLVCNGAFMLTRWDFKQRLLLTRNEHYWDVAAIEPRTIEVYISTDPMTALLAYETGRVDLVRGLDGALVRRLLSSSGVGAAPRRRDLYLADRFATFFLRVNCSRPPLDNADLRKALSLAADRAALCERVLGLGESPAFSFVPHAAAPYMLRRAPDGAPVLYSSARGLGAELDAAARIELAREHLRRSGYLQIAAQRPIELAYPPQPPLPRIAEALQSMWESALGIRVELRAQERKVLSTRIRELDYDLARSDWYGDYFDPSTFLEMFTSVSGQNRTGWKHAEYDRLISAALREPDAGRRFSLFTDAERILCEQELPIIPLYFKTGNYVLSPRIILPGAPLRDGLAIHRARLRG